MKTLLKIVFDTCLHKINICIFYTEAQFGSNTYVHKKINKLCFLGFIIAFLCFELLIYPRVI